jgi:hypothetical protein
MSEALPDPNESADPGLLTKEELVTLNNYIGNHEAQLAVAGIFAVFPTTTMPKSKILKELLYRQLPTTGNPSSEDHKIRVEEAGGWTPIDTAVGNWCIYSLEPSGLVEERIHPGKKGPQKAWLATELAIRALPYIGGLGEWSLNHTGISLQKAAGATKSTAASKARAPQIRHSIFRKLVSDRPDNLSTYEDLELAAAADGLQTNEVRDAALELIYQGLLTKSPTNSDGRIAIKIADKHKWAIRDLVQTLEDITTPDGAELYTARAQEILKDPKLFLPLIAKAKQFSSSRAGAIETHGALQIRITEALGVLGRAEVSCIYQHLQTTGRTINRHTIHKTMQELIDNKAVEALSPGSGYALSKRATTYTLK